MARRTKDTPTPDYIRAECAKIQATWSPAVRESRRCPDVFRQVIRLSAYDRAWRSGLGQDFIESMYVIESIHRKVRGTGRY